MEKTAEILMKLILVLVIAIILAWPVQLIWNDLFTSLFQLRRISLGEALELSIFCGVLFKN